MYKISGNQVLFSSFSRVKGSFGAKIRADFIAGMGKVSGKFVIILSVNNVLSLDDLALLEHAAGAEAPLLAEQRNRLADAG